MYISTLVACFVAVVNALDMHSYDEAVREHPKDFMAYYKRATAFLANNKEPQALKDLTRTLELNPDFEPGLFYRAQTNLRLGFTEKAESDLQKCSKARRCRELAGSCTQFQRMASAVDADISAKEWSDCIEDATEALSIAPRSLSLRRKRYSCYMSRGDSGPAIVDLMSIVSQDKSDSEAVSLLANNEFFLNNNQEKAMQLLRRCVNYDPDATKCVETSKKLRKMQKELKKPALQIDYGKMAKIVKKLGFPEDQSALLFEILRNQCDAYVKNEDWSAGANVCARVRDEDPSFVPAVLLQAHIELENRNYHEALQLVHSIRGSSDDPRIEELYHTIREESRPKQHAPTDDTKDLYKILGVDKKATKKEIKKAHRDLSKKYHPDKYKGTDLTKDQIMAKMQDINEAYEVLGDDERRKDYDMQRSGGGRGPSGPSFGGQNVRYQKGGFGGPGGFDNPEHIFKFFQQQQGGRGGPQHFKFAF